MDTADESSLVAAACAGDEAAFCSLVLMHQAAVRAFVSRWCRDAETADDIAQEVFIAAFTALPGYAGRSGFRTWLLGLARHKALDWLRAEGRRREVGSLDAVMCTWQAEGLDATVASDEELTALRACVDELPAASARLVQEFYAGASQAELSTRHRRSLGALRVSLFRLRRMLRQCVERRLATGGPGG